LKVVLCAIFQSPQKRNTLIYLCECIDDMKKEYIKIADELLSIHNKEMEGK
jgi:uncharacterized protein YcgL (UPF0745 family)